VCATCNSPTPSPPADPLARRSHTPEALASSAAAAAAAAAHEELELAADGNQASHLLGGSTAGSQLLYCAGLGAYCCGQALLDPQLLVDWAAKQLQQEHGQRDQALPLLVQLLTPAVQVRAPLPVPLLLQWALRAGASVSLGPPVGGRAQGWQRREAG
jgi:hypothetical protein